MKTDSIEIEILADGTLKVSTDKISAANHANATAFLAEMQKLAGGSVTKAKRARMPQVHQTQQRKETQ